MLSTSTTSKPSDMAFYTVSMGILVALLETKNIYFPRDRSSLIKRIAPVSACFPLHSVPSQSKMKKS